jgi:hypothetical protein
MRNKTKDTEGSRYEKYIKNNINNFSAYFYPYIMFTEKKQYNRSVRFSFGHVGEH